MADPERMVSLNDVADLLRVVSSGGLRDILARPGGGGVRSACDALCDCNIRYCTCHGSVSTVAREVLSHVELTKITEQRIADLKAQLEELEGAGGPDSRTRPR